MITHSRRQRARCRRRPSLGDQGRRAIVVLLLAMVAAVAQQHRDDGIAYEQNGNRAAHGWEHNESHPILHMFINPPTDDNASATRLRRSLEAEETDEDEVADEGEALNLFDDDEEDFEVYGIGVRKGKGGSKGYRPPPPRPAPRPPRPPPQHRPQPHPRPEPPPVPRPDPQPIPYPIVAPALHPNLPPVRPTAPSQNCVKSLTVKFLQFSALPPAVVVDPNSPDNNALGTQYVYGDSLYNFTTTDEILNSRAAGVCTRTQQLYSGDGLAFQVGGGFCQFTYKLQFESKSISITAAGEVFDRDGGVLAITGGSKEFVGAYGEVELLPAQIVTNGQYSVEEGDFFLAPLVYLGTAEIYVPQRNVCAA